MNKEKILKTYDLIMFSILIFIMCFTTFSISVNAANEDWTGSYTGECTLYELSDGKNVAIPDAFIEEHPDFIIYKSSVTNSYCIFIPNFDDYSYSSTSIYPMKNNGTTYSSLTDYLINVEDYANYPMFLLQGSNFQDGNNTLTLKYWEQDDATDMKLSDDGAIAYSSNLDINDSGFFFEWIQRGTLAEILAKVNLNPLGWVEYLMPLVMVLIVSLLGLKKALQVLQQVLHKA